MGKVWLCFFKMENVWILSERIKKWFYKALGLFSLLLFFSPAIWANVLGLNIQHYNATPNQLDFITVHSSRNLLEGQWNFGFHTHYSQNNLLIYDKPIANQARIKSEDTLLAADLVMAYGVTPQFELGFAVPWILDQTVGEEQYRKVFVTSGPNSLRTQFKYSFSGKSRRGVALLFSFDLPNVKDDPFMGKNPQPIYNLEAVFDVRSKLTAFAVNVGYRVRTPGDTVENAPLFPLDDQFIASLAFSSGFGGERKNFAFISELFYSGPAQKDPYKNERDISSLEVLLGARWAVARTQNLVAGLGFEALEDSLSPEWRLFFGYNVMTLVSKETYRDALIDEKPEADDSSLSPVMMPSFEEDYDRDGVADEVDQCPDTPAGESVDRDGCPLDSDADGIMDSQDQCPNTRRGEVVDPNGCSVLGEE